MATGVAVIMRAFKSSGFQIRNERPWVMISVLCNVHNLMAQRLHEYEEESPFSGALVQQYNKYEEIKRSISQDGHELGNSQNGFIQLTM